MATNTIPSPCPKSNLTRRAALSGAVAVGALALPAAAALTIEASKLSAGTDPHVAWWAERKEVLAEIGDDEYEPAADGLYSRKWDLEEAIAKTPAATPEGLALVSTVLLMWHAEVSYHEVDQLAGATLARRILDTTPADVLDRAGLA